MHHGFRGPAPGSPRPSLVPPERLDQVTETLLLPRQPTSCRDRKRKESAVRIANGRAYADSNVSAHQGAFRASWSPWKQATPRPSRTVVRKCAGARALARMCTSAQSPPAPVSGASYAAAAVTMAHYKVRGACGRWPAAGRLRVGVGARAQVLGVWGSDAAAGFVELPAPSSCSGPRFRPLTRRISSGRRLEARAVPEVLGEVRSAGHTDQGWVCARRGLLVSSPCYSGLRPWSVAYEGGSTGGTCPRSSEVGLGVRRTPGCGTPPGPGSGS